MQRSRQSRRREFRSSSAGLDQCEPIEPSHFVQSPYAAIEVQQIRAISEEDMLTVVDNLSRSGMLIRRGAPANERTTLKYGDMKSRFGKSAGCGKPRDTSADDSDSLLAPGFDQCWKK